MPIVKEYTLQSPGTWLCIEYIDPPHEEITRYMVFTDPDIMMPEDLNALKLKLNSYLNSNYEAKNTNIQAHISSAHAPANAQKNSDITKPEIEAKLTSYQATGAILSSGGGVGYSAGAGGAIIQTGSRTTAVILNKLCGNITMVSAAQAINAQVNFTLTNSFIAATDYLLVQHISATNGGAWGISTICGNGSAVISIRNNTTASITEATPLRFFVLKSVIT